MVDDVYISTNTESGIRMDAIHGRSMQSDFLDCKITRTATVVVAASNSRSEGTYQANYTCNGTDDNVQFQQALDALPSTGGEIHLLDGTYNFGAMPSRAIDAVTVSGCGNNTYITRDGNSPVLSLGSQKNWLIKDLRTDFGFVETIDAIKYAFSNVWIDSQFPEVGPVFIDNYSSDHSGKASCGNLMNETLNHPLVQPLENFESDWTVMLGSLTYSSAIKYIGSRSAMLTSPVGSSAQISKSSTYPDLTNCAFALPVYVPDYTKLSAMTLIVGTSGDGGDTWVNYATFYTQSIVQINEYWWLVTFDHITSSVGTPDMSNVTALRISIAPVSGQAVTIYLSQMFFWKKILTSGGAIGITGDDWYPSWMTIMKPILDEHNFKGSFAVPISKLTSSDIANLHTLQDQGHDIGNHTVFHHTTARSRSPEFEYLFAQGCLRELGFERGSRFAHLHGGYHDKQIVDIVNKHITLTRSSISGHHALPVIGNLLYARTVENTTSVDTIKGWINDAKTYNYLLLLMFHDFTSSAPTQYQCLDTNFEQVCAYIADQGIEVLTYSQIIDRIKQRHFTITTSATLPSNQTTVYVRHGFHTTPTSMTITPISSLGNAKNLWISTKNTGQGNRCIVSSDVAPGADVQFELTAIWAPM